MLRSTLRGFSLRAICPPRTSSTFIVVDAASISTSSTSHSTSAATAISAAPTEEANPPPTSTSSQPSTARPVTHTVTLPTTPRPASASAAADPSSNPHHLTPSNATSATVIQPSTKEPYSILRTPSAHLPVYHTLKAGGSLRQTLVRKVSGDAEALRAQLEAALDPPPKYVKVNPTTGHVVVKGWYKEQVGAFLEGRGF